MRFKGHRTDAANSSRPSASLHEPDLVLAVAVSGVGVASHDERVVDANTRRVEQLCHGVDLVNDGHFIGGTGKGPGGYKEVQYEYEALHLQTLEKVSASIKWHKDAFFKINIYLYLCWALKADSHSHIIYELLDEGRRVNKKTVDLF